jgi:hypothetical protein
MSLLRKPAQGVIRRAQSLAYQPTTDRASLLALSELARRAAGDRIAASDLSAHELRVFSQNGEDGVMAELIARSGAATRSFVEIGAGTGVENNTAVWADAFGWSGVLIEADAANFARLQRKYAPREDISTVCRLVTAENVGELLPDEFDLLAIDVDGSEYWIWEAIQARPRFVVVEYNSGLGGKRRLVQPRHRGAWDGTDYQGASIAALRSLGEVKGYRLVHAEMAGVNAFFLRDDLANEYPEPKLRGPNYFLVGEAHPPDPARRPYLELP